MLRSLAQKLINVVRYPPRFLYRKQIKIVYPVHTFTQYVGYQWVLPDGYTLCSPGHDTDLQSWASLLNSEPGFGTWTREKVASAILPHLIAPDAASLLFYKGRLIGCCSTHDCSTAQKKIGKLMWLVIDPAHRGMGLGRIVNNRTLAFFAREHYALVLGFTDPDRLTALRLYFSIGCMPGYDSLYSFVHWRKVKKNLRAGLSS